MAAHAGRLRAPVLLGVGAAFDIHAGTLRQAPPWMQRNGLEWLYRLYREPRRLARRYLSNNPRFVLAVLRRPPRLVTPPPTHLGDAGDAQADVVTEARPRILAIAYACMPDVGSEPGTGWAWARILAGIGDVWVLTRPWQDHHEQLVQAWRSAPEREHLHIVEVPMPGPWRGKAWDPFKSRFQRLEYIVWQLAALRTARRIARQRAGGPGLARHVRERVDGRHRRPGRPALDPRPVGGGIGPAWRMLPAMGWRGVAYETVRADRADRRPLAQPAGPLGLDPRGPHPRPEPRDGGVAARLDPRAHGGVPPCRDRRRPRGDAEGPRGRVTASPCSPGG